MIFSNHLHFVKVSFSRNAVDICFFYINGKYFNDNPYFATLRRNTSQAVWHLVNGGNALPLYRSTILRTHCYVLIYVVT